MRHKKSFLGTILVFIIGYVLCTPARAYEPSAIRPAQPPIMAVADESSSPTITSTNRIENERVPEATVPAVTVTSTTTQVARASSSSVESLSCRERLLNWSKRPGGRAIAVKMHLGKATEAKCFSSVIEANEYWGRKFNAMDLVPLAMSIQACESS